MTVQELHYEFKLKMDRVDSLSQQDFKVHEIDWLLNEAQLVFIKRRFTDLSNSKRKGFENGQKRIDDLATLVVKYPTQPPILTTLVDTGIYEADLDGTVYDYMFLVNAYVDIVLDETCTLKNTPLKFMQHDDIMESLRDPFNKPSYEFVPYNYGKSSSGTSTSIYVYGGDLPASAINSIYIEYVKKPSRISMGNYQYIDGVTYTANTSELPEQAHPELVDIACELAAMNIENPEYIQLKSQKVLTHE